MSLNSSRKLPSSRRPLSVIKDRPVFDVSLVTGHRDYLGRRSDFSRRFVQALAKAARKARRLAPVLQATPAGRLHFTLRSVYGGCSPDFPGKTSLAERRLRYAEVREWVKEAKIRNVCWDCYAITPEGILFLKGKATGRWLTRLRLRIDQTSARRSPFKPSRFCHIVLARAHRPLTVEERRRLQSWIRRQPVPQPQRMAIRSPVLLRTSNHFGTKYRTHL